MVWFEDIGQTISQVVAESSTAVLRGFGCIADGATVDGGRHGASIPFSPRSKNQEERLVEDAGRSEYGRDRWDHDVTAGWGDWLSGYVQEKEEAVARRSPEYEKELALKQSIDVAYGVNAEGNHLVKLKDKPSPGLAASEAVCHRNRTILSEEEVRAMTRGNATESISEQSAAEKEVCTPLIHYRMRDVPRTRL